ncbi:MAG TPA: hypothetical protein VLC91_00355 [Spongiibacteraceae bacterium]|nr:hypothetical protein [Spongiibacteraceae bacterium]
MTDFTVEIINDGRGGSIIYREGDNSIDYSFELAMPPSIVLIFGPSGRSWDRNYSWAAGRCEAIYNAVGAEVVRQKVMGGRYTIDIDGTTGIIDVISR